MARPRQLLGVCILVACICHAGWGLAASTVAQNRADPDARIEQCLQIAKVRGRGKPLEGITNPVKFTVECDGERRSAVFKSHESYRRGVTRFTDGSWEFNFSDSFRYERAAYLLDRELDLNMVPVAVIRWIGREQGVLIDWVHGYHLGEPDLTVTPHLIAALAPQKASMHLFDALIYNVDRNLTNWMTDESGRLYLIDHSRSFRISNELPEGFSNRRIWLSQHLYRRLRDLERDRLFSLLDDLLEPAQIDAILARRDRLIEAIESARMRLGDDVVFQD